MKSAIRIPHSAIRKGRTAFTLMELLIAIGILAVGGAMAAALFPAAIKENQSSYNNTLGTIICENGLATIKAMYVFDPAGTSADENAINTSTTSVARRLQEIESGYSFQAPQITISGNNQPYGYLGPISHYPINNTGTNADDQGFYFIALQHDGNNNDYTFVIIAYQRVSGNLPEFYPLSGTLEDTSGTPTNIIEVTSATADEIPVNALIIIDSGSGGTCQQGEYARVVRKDGTDIILDHNLITQEGTAVNFWVFRDQDEDIVRSPAMNVLVARTSLRTN